jgi:hypothetical protein
MDLFSPKHIIILLLLAAILAVYFIPSLVARNRNHPSALAIFVLNLLLGWSLIAWVVALVWAFSGPPGQVPRQSFGAPSPTKNCPACAEEILAAARKCKHCGEQLAA